MHVQIMDKRWELVFTNKLPSGSDGCCDPPNTTRKRLRVSRKLEGEERLEVIIHEILHAANWSLCEDHVTVFAQDLARILTRLGYETNR